MKSHARVSSHLAGSAGLRQGGSVSRKIIWTAAIVMGLSAGGLLLVPTVGAEPLATIDGKPVELEGDQLEVNLQTGRAILTGNVRIERRDLRVTCERVEARYDKAPAVRWAKATGGVRAKVGSFEARAQEAELQMDRGYLALRGDVTLRRGVAWMRAREAWVDLASKKVTLQQVRGRLTVSSTFAKPRPSASR